MPHYGYRRPSSDYYNSNLIVQNFVIADVTNGTNHIYFYDERGQGKDGNALSSLRIAYHLTKSENTTISLDILDNCVGQNKSNTTMMFCAMMSLLFYKKVACLFLIPGHSHMIADRVVAWLKNSIRGKQIFHPSDFVECSNAIKSVNASFLDHTGSNSNFFIGWDSFLGKYFKKLPSGFTQCYFFEFENGSVTYRHLCNTPDSEAFHFTLCNTSNLAIIKNAIAMELFGTVDRSQWSMKTLSLPKHPGVPLKNTKLASLAKKYFSIPPDKLDYYPKVPSDIESMIEEDINVHEEIPVQTRQGKKARKEKNSSTSIDPVGARKPGRPKQVLPVPKGCQSILNFFQKNSN
jgi:hypothetical protein